MFREAVEVETHIEQLQQVLQHKIDISKKLDQRQVSARALSLSSDPDYEFAKLKVAMVVEQEDLEERKTRAVAAKEKADAKVEKLQELIYNIEANKEVFEEVGRQLQDAEGRLQEMQHEIVRVQQILSRDFPDFAN